MHFTNGTVGNLRVLPKIQAPNGKGGAKISYDITFDVGGQSARFFDDNNPTFNNGDDVRIFGKQKKRFFRVRGIYCVNNGSYCGTPVRFQMFAALLLLGVTVAIGYFFQPLIGKVVIFEEYRIPVFLILFGVLACVDLWMIWAAIRDIAAKRSIC